MMKTISQMAPLGTLVYRVLPLAALLAGLLHSVIGSAQVPIPVEEQVRMFQQLPPSQQQALIRELQEQLPPAQRQAILGMLRSGAPAPDQEGAQEEGERPERQLEGAMQGFDLQALLKEPEVRFAAGDTVVIEFTLRVDETTGQAPANLPEGFGDFQERLARGNPYTLDDNGQLLLPGVRPIALAGLNVDEATIRVQAEPVLRPLSTVLTRLPLQPAGFYAVKPFGYDLFDRPAGQLAPATDIPVPVDYVIGPGDTVYVQLFGNMNEEYYLPVNREGVINFPAIGPLSVSGLTFVDLRNLINERVGEQMIGVRASTTLGELRSIRVYVLGDVKRPGSYTISGLSTMANALLASGGVKPIGSLRRVRLLRDGNAVANLDLYDALLRGDTSGDVRLQPGDVIFVPPVGTTVAVDGQVRRPAIYELANERTVAEIVALAGGLNPNANQSAIKLERIVAGRGTSVEDVDLGATTGAQQAVRDGDIVRVLPNLSQLENSVRLEGNVFQPGPRQWFPGMRVGDLLTSPDIVKPMSDLNYVLIRREPEPNVRVQVLSADVESIWKRTPGARNIALEARDTVYVFSRDIGRSHVVRPLIDELTAEAPPNSAVPVVRVAGQVRAQGEYPLEPGMRVSDLLRAGGGLGASAYLTSAELTRYAVIDGEYRETEFVDVDLAAVLRGDGTADLALTPYDYLNVKEVPRWKGQESVLLEGEVVFPGNYPIRRGETLSSVLRRAGGLTDLAFPEGSVFTRLEFIEREKEQLELMARRIERDLATISVTEPSAGETISTGQTLIAQLRSTEATGRLVIRLDDIVRGVAEADVILKDGDVLRVPDQQQEVTVLGEVQYATSHLYDRALSRDEYIGKSGGLTSRADQRRIYVVRANGEVVAQSGGRWFQRGSMSGVRPGDTIVVPLDVDRPLARWTSITQIVYQMAIAAAAVASF
jgi:protein involved in polysaccharide export with SLBB domain